MPIFSGKEIIRNYNKEVIDDHYPSSIFVSRAAVQSRQLTFLGNAFAFLIPMLIFLEVDFIGRLFFSEILLFLMLPFLLIMRGKSLFSPLPKRFLLLELVWLLAQILTDVIRVTPFEDWSRGWAKIIFLLLNFAAIYLLLNEKRKRFILFAAGIALGQILGYFFNPNVFAEDHPWKFGYGFAITILVVLIVQLWVFKRRTSLQSFILIGMGILNFYMGFRSLGLICMLTAAYVFLQQSNRFYLKKINWRTVVILLLLSITIVYGITVFYGYAQVRVGLVRKRENCILCNPPAILEFWWVDVKKFWVLFKRL